MTFNDNTKRIVLIVLVVIILLSVIFPLLSVKIEEQRATLNIDSLKSLWWALQILRFVSILTLIFLLPLFFYEDWLRRRIDTNEVVHKAKTAVLIIFCLILILLILLVAEYLLILYLGSNRIIYHSIKYSLFGLFFGYLLLHYWKVLKYFRIQPLHKIVAFCLLEQHEKLIKNNDLDKAYTVLLKACETDSDGVWLWCRLALFCERTRNNSAETDKYMAKAEELITTTKASSISDKACYLDYLGLINYVRGEHDKGLGYIKQAIDIEPKPFRIKTYEGLLSDSKNTQPDTNPPDPKTVT